MDLGAFSISLAVKDIAASRAFYETLGFEVIGGEQEQNWLILRNRDATIGLFQGMFERNLLTFTAGLDGTTTAEAGTFTDVREIQRHLKANGIALAEEADEGASGPAHIAFADPDGNSILIDQFK